MRDIIICALRSSAAELVFTSVPDVMYEGGKATVAVATRDLHEKTATISLVPVSGKAHPSW